jgi:hypothetical protein
MGEKKTQKELMEEQLKQFYSFVESMKKSMGLPMVPDMKTGKALWIDQRSLGIRYIISVDKVRDFFNGLADGKLMATKCRDCGEIYFPPQTDCFKCRKSDIEWIELSKEGTLLTYTQINIKPYSFSHYDDYIVGIGRLPEGVNVTAWVREKDPKRLRIGMRLRLEIVKREPEDYYVYEWVPVE